MPERRSRRLIKDAANLGVNSFFTRDNRRALPRSLVSLSVVRMIWWFLIVAAAAGAVLWAGLSAYLQVRQRLRNAENKPQQSQGRSG
jgi:hypothetical protein